jgi:hypothetical protein
MKGTGFSPYMQHRNIDGALAPEGYILLRLRSFFEE